MKLKTNQPQIFKDLQKNYTEYLSVRMHPKEIKQSQTKTTLKLNTNTPKPALSLHQINAFKNGQRPLNILDSLDKLHYSKPTEKKEKEEEGFTRRKSNNSIR